MSGTFCVSLQNDSDDDDAPLDAFLNMESIEQMARKFAEKATHLDQADASQQMAKYIESRQTNYGKICIKKVFQVLRAMKLAINNGGPAWRTEPIAGPIHVREVHPPPIIKDIPELTKKQMENIILHGHDAPEREDNDDDDVENSEDKQFINNRSPKIKSELAIILDAFMKNKDIDLHVEDLEEFMKKTKRKLLNKKLTPEQVEKK